MDGRRRSGARANESLETTGLYCAHACFGSVWYLLLTLYSAFSSLFVFGLKTVALSNCTATKKIYTIQLIARTPEVPNVNPSLSR